jgi:hypothetical protein
MIRILADFIGEHWLRTIGSWINVLAILMFLGGVLFRILNNIRMERR